MNTKELIALGEKISWGQDIEKFYTERAKWIVLAGGVINITPDEIQMIESWSDLVDEQALIEEFNLEDELNRHDRNTLRKMSNFYQKEIPVKVAEWSAQNGSSIEEIAFTIVKEFQRLLEALIDKDLRS